MEIGQEFHTLVKLDMEQGLLHHSGDTDGTKVPHPSEVRNSVGGANTDGTGVPHLSKVRYGTGVLHLTEVRHGTGVLHLGAVTDGTGFLKVTCFLDSQFLTP